MISEWEDCSSIHDLAAAMDRGDWIEKFYITSWIVWDQKTWDKTMTLRCCHSDSPLRKEGNPK